MGASATIEAPALAQIQTWAQSELIHILKVFHGRMH